ncbi:MAG: hypothetical protein ABW088_00210 [Sedimenticola sp.]
MKNYRYHPYPELDRGFEYQERLSVAFSCLIREPENETFLEVFLGALKVYREELGDGTARVPGEGCVSFLQQAVFSDHLEFNDKGLKT